MQCDRCKKDMGNEESCELYGQVLCEDCYMEALSPVKTCDPWAVHSAKSFSGQKGEKILLTENQRKIIQFLTEANGVEFSVISRKLNIPASDLERDIAALRHMEKVRAQMQDGKKVICLW